MKKDLSKIKEELYKVLNAESITSDKALTLSRELDKIILEYYKSISAGGHSRRILSRPR